MSECMTQEDAERMDASQAVQILKPLRTMMLDRYGCPISEVYFALGKAIEALEQPTLDAVTVVHGHWEIVPNDDNRDDHYKMRCSVCGETLWSIHSEELYCCKCGAKMDDYDDGERREYEQIHKG